MLLITTACSGTGQNFVGQWHRSEEGYGDNIIINRRDGKFVVEHAYEEKVFGYDKRKKKENYSGHFSDGKIQLVFGEITYLKDDDSIKMLGKKYRRIQ